jgi:hypothetical protein
MNFIATNFVFKRIREVSDCISTALAGEGDILPTVDDLKIFQRFSDKDWWNGEEGKQLLEKAGILYQRYANTLEVYSFIIISSILSKNLYILAPYKFLWH